MAIGSSLGITLPTQGGNTGTWGTDLNTELNKIITAVEAQVPITAIDFSTDLAAGDNGITSLSHISFDDQTAVADLTAVYTVAGELYFRDGANQQVQISLDGALNSSSGGGIGDSGGNYGTGSISFDWDGTRYNARNGPGAEDYANVRMDELMLRDGSGNNLTVDVPAMSSDYSLSLPTAVPGTNGTLVQSDTSGNLTFANTGIDDITLAANQHVTVSGTGEYKHGARWLTLDATALKRTYTTPGVQLGSFDTSGIYDAESGTDIVILPIPLDVGARILQIKYAVYFQDASVRRIGLWWKDVTSITSTPTEHDFVDPAGVGAGRIAGTFNNTNLTISSEKVCFLKVTLAHASDNIRCFQIQYDRP